MDSEFTSAFNEELVMPASKFCNRMDLIGYDGMIISKFLGQLWSLFGNPMSIGFEGFTYQIKDTKTNVIFQAYSAGSGPAYCFSNTDKEKAAEILKRLEKKLANSVVPDFEVVIKNDFGTLILGSKNGQTYETQKSV